MPSKTASKSPSAKSKKQAAMVMASGKKASPGSKKPIKNMADLRAAAKKKGA